MRYSAKTSLNIKTSSLIVLMHSAKKNLFILLCVAEGLGLGAKNLLNFHIAFLNLFLLVVA
jgi:hypothetical protein